MGAASVPTYATWQNNTNPSWWKDPGLRANVWCCVVLYLGVYSYGYDGTYLTGLQALDSWNAYFGSPAGNTLGLISACAYFPTFVVTPIIPWAADRFGRKPVLLVGAAGIIVGALIGAFANGMAMLIIGRVIVGGSANCCSVSAICLLNEIVHPRLRSVAAALLMTFYYIGSIVAAWATFGCVYWPNDSDWSWRLPTLLQALGPFALICGWFFVPESPRYLMAHGRHDEARLILERYHANGSTDDELVKNEVVEIQAALDLEGQNTTSWATLFATPGNRRRMLVLFTIALGSQWTGLGLVSYYLSPILKTVGITSSGQIAGINGGLSVWNWLLSLAGALLVERAGRRPLWIISTGAMLGLWCIFTALNATFAETGNSAAGSAVIAFIFLFNGAYDVAWTPMVQSYTSEILPYHLRAKGMSLFAFVASVCVAINQYVNPVALAAIDWKYYFVYVALLAAFLVMAWFFFVETKGLTSEEVGALFDGKADELYAHALEVNNVQEKVPAKAEDEKLEHV